MSLPVDRMVATGDMKHTDCILCGECVDGCKKEAIAYKFGCPRRVLERPPSAELAPDQKDQDSLPPYEVLDPILERYIEGDRSIEEIVADGFDADVVTRVVRMVDRNEYKRRQAPPGIRISRRAFGRDRRYPITSGYTSMRPVIEDG